MDLTNGWIENLRIKSPINDGENRHPQENKLYKKKKEKQSCRNIVKVKVEVFFLVEEEEDPEGG